MPSTLHCTLAKVCELMAMELSARAHFFCKESRRITVTAEDVRRGAQSTDVFDFLLDVLAREEDAPP